MEDLFAEPNEFHFELSLPFWFYKRAFGQSSGLRA